MRRADGAPRRGWSAVLPLACSLVLLAPMALGDPLIYSWATVGLLTALWVLSLNLVWGMAGQLSLAQLSLGAVSGYVFVLSAREWGFSLALAVLAGVVSAVVAGIFLSIAALRLRGFYFVIATAAFALAVTTTAAGMEVTGRTAGILVSRFELPTITLGPVEWELSAADGGFYALVAACFAVITCGAYYLSRTPTGRSMLAVRDDEMLAMSLGMSAMQVKTVAFIAAAVTAGIAGILQALYYQLVAPEIYSIDQVLMILMLLALAGRGNLYAPFVAGLFYVILYQALAIDGDLRAGVLGLIVVLVVLVAPGGLIGLIHLTWSRLLGRLPRVQRSTESPRVFDSQTTSEES